jgi:hypothetical protein
MGEVILSDLSSAHTPIGDFHRSRVNIDSTKPLTCFVSLNVEGQGRTFLQVKYEKLAKFCDHCGLMGHTYMECGTGEYVESELQWGSWMVAEE